MVNKIPMTAEGAARRAEFILASWSRTLYVLGAGGRNPKASDPFTIKDGKLGADCIGYVLWALGVSRYQPTILDGMIGAYGGWVNTDSSIGDAKGASVLFEITHQPRVGDLVVYPGKDGRKGHVAIVVEVTTDTSYWTSNLWLRGRGERARFLRHVKVIDCAASLMRRLLGKAVMRVTAARSWNRPDAMFIRYKGFTP